jgi:hypothetical protein
MNRLGILSLLLVIVVLFHVPLLRCLAGVLVVEEPELACNPVLLLDTLDGNRGFVEAFRLHNLGGAPRILVVEGHVTRCQRLGIIDSIEELARRQCLARGVDPEALTVLHAAEPGRATEIGRCLDGWMDQHPSAQVTVITRRFMSRKHYGVFTATVKPRNASRLHWRAPADRRYDENNWWHCKEGVLAFFDSSVRLVHHWLSGEDDPESYSWNLDDYERDLPRR